MPTAEVGISVMSNVIQKIYRNGQDFSFLSYIHVNSLYRERGGVFAHPPACAGMCSDLFALNFRGTSVKNSKQWEGYITLVSDLVQGA